MKTQEFPVPSGKMWTLVSQNDSLEIPPTTVITPPFRIGRREGFDLCLPCRNASGLHAEILEKDGVLWIYDLNSTNGTFVNGRRIHARTQIEQGDTLLFGNCTFEVATCGTGSGRSEMATLQNFTPEPVETPEDRFQRLIESGATPNFQPVFDISAETPTRIGFEVLGRSPYFACVALK